MGYKIGSNKRTTGTGHNMEVTRGRRGVREVQEDKGVKHMVMERHKALVVSLQCNTQMTYYRMYT